MSTTKLGYGRRFLKPMVGGTAVAVVLAAAAPSLSADPSPSSPPAVSSPTAGFAPSAIAQQQQGPSWAEVEATMKPASGGPFVSPTPLEQEALTGLGCSGLPASSSLAPASLTTDEEPVGPVTTSLAGTPTASECSAVAYQYFPSLDQAQRTEGVDWTPGGIGSSREIYFVTVHGSLPYVTTQADSSDLLKYVPALSWMYDATTGAWLGGD